MFSISPVSLWLLCSIFSLSDCICYDSYVHVTVWLELRVIWILAPTVYLALGSLSPSSAAIITPAYRTVERLAGGRKQRDTGPKHTSPCERLRVCRALFGNTVQLSVCIALIDEKKSRVNIKIATALHRTRFYSCNLYFKLQLTYWNPSSECLHLAVVVASRASFLSCQYAASFPDENVWGRKMKWRQNEIALPLSHVF